MQPTLGSSESTNQRLTVPLGIPTLRTYHLLAIGTGHSHAAYLSHARSCDRYAACAPPGGLGRASDHTCRSLISESDAPDSESPRPPRCARQCSTRRPAPTEPQPRRSEAVAPCDEYTLPVQPTAQALIRVALSRRHVLTQVGTSSHPSRSLLCMRSSESHVLARHRRPSRRHVIRVAASSESRPTVQMPSRVSCPGPCGAGGAVPPGERERIGCASQATLQQRAFPTWPSGPALLCRLGSRKAGVRVQRCCNTTPPQLGPVGGVPAGTADSAAGAPMRGRREGQRTRAPLHRV